MTTPSLVIGIAGGSGSGKSWFARKVRDAFASEATLIEQDWYYRDLSGLSAETVEAVNFDHPDSIEFPLLLQQLESLKRGERVQAPGYRYSNHQRIENANPLNPTPLLIIEGLFTLYDTRIRELLDRSVFIEADAQVRFERRFIRDVKQRGYSKQQIARSWHEHVTPMFEQFVKPSAAHADIVWNPLRDSAFENAFLVDLRNQLAKDGKPKP